MAAGASPLTLAGLSGIGDIVLTCTGDLSRNRAVGVRLGKGEKLEDITASMKVGAKEWEVVCGSGKEKGMTGSCPPLPCWPGASPQAAAACSPPASACLQGAVAEGVLTSRSAHHLAQKKGIECPVIEGIYRVRAWLGGWSGVCGRAGQGSSPPQLAGAGRPRRRKCRSQWLLRPHASLSHPPLRPLQVIHEGADPVQVVTENMSRPLKAEVNPMVAEAAHYAEVPASTPPASTPGCTI